MRMTALLLLYHRGNGRSRTVCAAMLAGAVLSLAALAHAATPSEATRPAILTRTEWSAKEPLSGLVPHRIKGIIVHHTGVGQNPRTSFKAKLRNLQAFSQRSETLASGRRKPAWPDLPYHFYIDASGTIAEGRDVRFAGDTNTNYDPSGYVQVVLEGNFDKEQPTAAQLKSLKQVLRWQMSMQSVPIDGISVHKDHASTNCPGKNLAAAIPGILAALKSERAR